VWRFDGLGSGFSSVSVADGRIFTMGDAEGAQWTVALSEERGTELWRTRVGPPWVDGYGGPRSTPTIDDDRLYVLGTDADLLCLDAATGEVRWRRNLDDDFGGFMAAGQGMHWRRAESPLIDGERLIVSPGAREAMMVALDKLTGEEIWRAEVPRLGERGADGAGYSSAVVSEAAGIRQYVQLNGRGAFGVAADDGRFLWGYNRIANDVANIATPVIDGDRVIASTGYGTGAAMLRLVADGEGGVDAEEVWFLAGNELQNHHGGMILVDGVLYTGTGHNQGFPIAVRAADGEVLWGPVRNQGSGSAAISYADGSLYLRYQSGIMILVDATAEEYRQRGVFPIPDPGSYSWSHPVIANGRLYVREQDHLLAYDVRRVDTAPTN
jgi:outer membrane protein assembly factor BamB